MAEAKVENHRPKRVAEFLREPLEAAQARIEHIEVGAQRVIKDIVVRGRAGRKDIEQMVHRISKQDFSIDELKGRLEKLREQSADRAAEWRDRADSLRAEAVERIVELQGRAISFLGVATREQVEALSKELDRLARRLERGEKGKKPAKKSKPAAEV
jgi:DNA-binding transcriptional MerR regulator